MINLPITVNLTLDQSKTVFAMALESTVEEVTLSNSTVINATIIQVPQYDGEYTITPLANSATTLATKGKMMNDDVTVTKIPTYQTHNDSGITFYIAEV